MPRGEFGNVAALLRDTKAIGYAARDAHAALLVRDVPRQVARPRRRLAEVVHQHRVA